MGQWIGRHAVAFVVSIGFLAFLLYEVSAAFFAYTGDAYVAADTVVIAPNVEGPIARLAVRNDERVAAGQLLFEIDRRPFQLAVDELKAGIGLAEANLAQARDAVSAAEAAVDQRQAVLKDATETRLRLRELFAQADIAAQRLDDANRDATVAQALLIAAQSHLVSARQTVQVMMAELDVARARLAQAQYRLSQTTVTSPASGRIAPFTARAGDYRKAGEAVMAIVTDTNWRVVANLTERHLARLRPGQTVWLTLGSRPWQLRRGRVRAVAGGISRDAGAVKVLPYVEPTTDWIRLPRRFPVEIDIADLSAVQPLYLGADARVLVWF